MRFHNQMNVHQCSLDSTTNESLFKIIHTTYSRKPKSKLMHSSTRRVLVINPIIGGLPIVKYGSVTDVGCGTVASLPHEELIVATVALQTSGVSYPTVFWKRYVSSGTGFGISLSTICVLETCSDLIVEQWFKKKRWW